MHQFGSTFSLKNVRLIAGGIFARKKWNRIKKNMSKIPVPAAQQLGKEIPVGKGASDTSWDSRGHHTRATASLCIWLQTKFISLNADMC